MTDSTFETVWESPIDEAVHLTYPTFSPGHVTDLGGKRRALRYRNHGAPTLNDDLLRISNSVDSTQSLSFTPLNITRLIPIRVKTGDEDRDVILWYHPHVRLLAALPHPVQLQLRDEVASIEGGIPAGDTTLTNYRRWISRTRYELDSILAARQPIATDTEDPAVTGSCYLSFCTITSGGINGAPIFPNPAHDVVTVGYRLMGRRTVTITLHDINGSQVRQLVAPHMKEAGRWEMQGSLVGVKPGIYLVVVSTERREQVVQRVIVE